jgi:hypothetical protein
MTTNNSRRGGPAWLAGPVLVAVSGLAACGTTTIDPKSGENVIKKGVNANAGVSVKSVSCPSDIKPKDGNTMNCSVTVTDKSNNQDHKGTITLHVTANGKRLEYLPSQDVHLQ